MTSGIDLALALIEQDAGRKVAIEVARMLVVYLKRAGGQSQYSALLAAQAQSESDTFSELEQWIAEHLKTDLRVVRPDPCPQEPLSLQLGNPSTDSRWWNPSLPCDPLQVPRTMLSHSTKDGSVLLVQNRDNLLDSLKVFVRSRNSARNRQNGCQCQKQMESG